MSSSDRNLLFGILAVQMDFVRRNDLIEAMNAWVLEKHRRLDDILVTMGFLSETRRSMLAPLVEEHIRQHDGDPQKSLAALSSVASIQEDLAKVTDHDVEKSLLGLRKHDVEMTRSILSGSGTQTEDEPVSNGPKTTQVDPRQRFRIIRPHARGGLGEVFVAKDQELGREVALKEIQKEHARNSLSRDRFVREAEITGGLEHPGIVPVYGLGHYDDGRPYYAMRFIRGASLKEAIEDFHGTPFAHDRERNLKLRDLLGRFVDVCNAVEYAHSRGVLHRDLKPGNIMLGKYGETLVVDWGLAKVVGRDEDHRNDAESTLSVASTSGSSETLPGLAIGTPAFMSPEQAEGKLDTLGPATDVYSLGATLYMLLVGKPPFEGNAVEVLEQVKNSTFPPPQKVDPRVPKTLSGICVHAMASDPARRYASCALLASDVERWLADEPVSAVREPISVRLGRWARRNRTAVASAFVLLVTGLSALTINRVMVGLEQNKTVQALHDAEQAKDATLIALGEAQQAKDAAEGSRQEALETAERESKAKDAANEQWKRAERLQQEKIRSDYNGAVGIAHHAMESGNAGKAIEALRKYEPKPGVPDYRSFEFGYLLRSCLESHRTFRGHASVLTGLACAPDGKSIASISADTSVVVWDAATAQRKVVLQDATKGSLIDVEYSPDGNILAAGIGAEVRLLDVATYQHKRTLPGDETQVRDIAFFPDGSRIASVSQTRLYIREIETGEPVAGVPREGIKLPVEAWCVAVNPKGDTVAIGMGAPFGFGGSSAQLLDVATGKLSESFSGHSAAIYAIAFSPDGKSIATASGDWTAKLWDVASRRELKTFKGHSGSIGTLAFSPDGKSLLTGSGDRTAKLWNVETGQCQTTLRAHTNVVTAVRFLPDGKSVATASADQTIRIWPLETPEYVVLEGKRPGAGVLPLLRSFSDTASLMERAQYVFSVDFTPDGKRVVVGRMALPSPGQVDIWDRVSGTVIANYPGRPGSKICTVAASPNGKLFAMGEAFTLPTHRGVRSSTKNKAKVLVREIETGNVVADREVESDSILSLRFSPDSQWLVAAHISGINYFSLKDESSFSMIGAGATDIAISPDAKMLAASDEGVVRIKNFETRDEIARVPVPGVVFGVCFSPDGKTLAAGTADAMDQKYLAAGSLYLIDVASALEEAKQSDQADEKTGLQKTAARKFASLPQFCRFLKFTSNGSRLVSVCGDGSATIWDVADQTNILTLHSPRPGVAGALSADDTLFAMGCDDGSVRIWSAQLSETSRATWLEGLMADAIADQRWDDALRFGKDLLKLRPTDGTLRYQIGRINWEMGYREKAQQIWLQAWADLPHGQMTTDFGYWIGSMYLEIATYNANREYKRMERVFEFIAEVNATNGPSAIVVEMLFKQANTRYGFLKQPESALEIYRRAVAMQKTLKEKNSPDLQAALNWDVARLITDIAVKQHFSKGEYEPAEKLMLEAMREREALLGSADAEHIFLYRLYRCMGRWDDAEKELSIAVQQMRNEWYVNNLQRDLASMHRQMGKAGTPPLTAWPQKKHAEPVAPSDVLVGARPSDHGVKAVIFTDDSFRKKVAERVDPRIDFIWWNRSPLEGMPEGKFAMRWTGWLRSPKPGNHQLRFVVDGCAALWIDGNLLINRWPTSGPRPYGIENEVTEINLNDEPHFVQIDYFDPGGTAAATLQWIPLGETRPVAIPSECWFLSKAAAQANKPADAANKQPEGSGLKAEIYRGDHFENLIATRVDPQIHFFWEKDSPGSDMPPDYFSIRWTGKLVIPKDGNYRIWLEGDDGFRMMIDGKEENNSLETSGTSYWSDRRFWKAGPHDILVEFREGHGSAWISLRWQREGEDGFSEEPVPPSAFLLPGSEGALPRDSAHDASAFNRNHQTFP